MPSLGLRSRPGYHLADALVRILRRRPTALVLLGVVVALDFTIKMTSPPYGILGLLDEPAHLATAAIALAAVVRLRPLSPSLLLAALASSVLLDADHVPQVLGWQGLTAGAPRPYSHSLLTVVVLGLVSAVASRRRASLRDALTGASAGVALHLWRDLGTGQVSLFWPLSLHPFDLPYVLYLSSLIVVALSCGSRSAQGPQRKPADL